MIYKSSFNGLEISVTGIYKVYNISGQELEALRRHFSNMINGSNGNYTVYQNSRRRVLLKLFVHELWIPIAFDIRDDLLKVFNSKKIYEKKIEKLSKILRDRRLCLHVNYDFAENVWSIPSEDYEALISTISEIVNDENF